jgi:hypothetical protein
MKALLLIIWLILLISSGVGARLGERVSNT